MLDGKIDYQQLKLICVSGLSGRVSEIRIPMISYVQNETSPWFHMVPVPLHRLFAPRNFRASELRQRRSQVGVTANAGSDNLEAMALKTLSPAQALRLC